MQDKKISKLQDILKNVKILKEKSKEGDITGYIVSVNQGGYTTKQRFDDLTSAYTFIKGLGLDKEPAKSRRFDRIRSVNIISFECFDEKDELVSHGIGRTLNVSQGGILLETYLPIDQSHKLILSLDMEDGLVMDIKSKLVYCRKRAEGKYESGIEFLAGDDTINRVVNKHLEALKNHIDPDESE